MKNESQIQLHDRQGLNGGIWYELRSEREEVCEALLHTALRSEKAATLFPEALVLGAEGQRPDRSLEARLMLIDEALDRLITGTYGDCAICGRWIEDRKLHLDPAFPFCVACEREQKGSVSSHARASVSH